MENNKLCLLIGENQYWLWRHCLLVNRVQYELYEYKTILYEVLILILYRYKCSFWGIINGTTLVSLWLSFALFARCGTILAPLWPPATITATTILSKQQQHAAIPKTRPKRSFLQSFLQKEISSKRFLQQQQQLILPISHTLGSKRRS